MRTFVGGFGGTFCVKYPDISTRMVSDKVRDVVATGAETVLAGDLGCLLNIAGRLQREGHRTKVRHVAEVLAGMTGKVPPIGRAGSTLQPPRSVSDLGVSGSRNSFSRSVWGLRTCVGEPLSTISPRSMNMTRSATWRANPISCVTQTMVMPNWPARSSLSTSLIISGSSAEVGSSNNIILGRIHRARAIATRCCCPPTAVRQFPCLLGDPDAGEEAHR